MNIYNFKPKIYKNHLLKTLFLNCMKRCKIKKIILIVYLIVSVFVNTY